MRGIARRQRMFESSFLQISFESIYVWSIYHVLVYGHSFVTSFKDHLINLHRKQNNTISFPRFVAVHLKVAKHMDGVHLIGLRGGKIMENMHLPTKILNTLKPEIVILEASANDSTKAI